MQMCGAVFVLVSSTVKFEVKVGVHQASVISPLLFIIVLEAITRVLLWGPLGGPLCQRNVSEGS